MLRACKGALVIPSLSSVPAGRIMMIQTGAFFHPVFGSRWALYPLQASSTVHTSTPVLLTCRFRGWVTNVERNVTTSYSWNSVLKGSTCLHARGGKKRKGNKIKVLFFYQNTNGVRWEALLEIQEEDLGVQETRTGTDANGKNSHCRPTVGVEIL